MAATLTEATIKKVRELIARGDLVPGQRLPAEAALSELLGVSRSGLREAVQALATARVLEVRRGDGTYVTSLTPEVLFSGIAEAVELMRVESLLEVMECRRVVEPQVAALAAVRARPEQLGEVEECLRRMERAETEHDLVAHDEQFHLAVSRAAGNEALTAMLRGVSAATVRARVWRALTETGSRGPTIAEHAAIWEAVRDGDRERAHAAALLHVAGVEIWMRRAFRDASVTGHRSLHDLAQLTPVP